MNILLLGPLTDKKDTTRIGGTTVLFELLLKELRDRKIEFDVIDTYKDNYSNVLTAYVYIVFKLIISMRKYNHVSLQATANSFILIGPIMVFLAKIFNKKISVRKFAGNFHEIYENASKLKKFLIEYVLKNSDVNFFETKYLVEYFRSFNECTYWFPNVRSRVIEPSAHRSYNRKFVFIGTINPEKGIDEICEAVQHLDSTYVVDIYGPIYNKKYHREYFSNINVSYQGALNANNVIKILDQYDVLLLPSYREGYPGIIIEAMSIGIPVITTKLNGIMEMVKDKYNGLLIDIRSSSQLVEAIQIVNESMYKKLSKNAEQSFTHFDSQVQTKIFLERIGVVYG